MALQAFASQSRVPMFSTILLAFQENLPAAVLICFPLRTRSMTALNPQHTRIPIYSMNMSLRPLKL